MPSEHQAADGDELDLARRVLCSDGSCIGVIGPDGRCRECGAELDPADREAFEHAFADADADASGAGAEAAEQAGEASSSSSADDDDDDGGSGDADEASSGSGSGASSSPDDAPLDLAARQLCVDGACIGVIGADGRCRECGKPAEGAA